MAVLAAVLMAVLAAVLSAEDLQRLVPGYPASPDLHDPGRKGG